MNYKPEAQAKEFAPNFACASGLYAAILAFSCNAADGFRLPNILGADEVEQFLTYLAVQRPVSASTQNQALLKFMAGAVRDGVVDDRVVVHVLPAVPLVEGVECTLGAFAGSSGRDHPVTDC